MDSEARVFEHGQSGAAVIPAWLIRYGLGALALVGLFIGIHHHGYAAGKVARDQFWQPRFLAAEKAAAEANAHTAAIESAQTAATAAAEARNAEVITSVNARAADAERRLRALSVRLAARSASCSGEVSAPSGAASVPDDSTASAERAQRAADALVGLARRCELDAATVRGWQDWYRVQSALMRP